MRRVQGRSGHEVRTLTIAEIDVPFLRSQDEWMHGALPAQFENAQEALKWADHLVIVYPLWLGDVPAYLKACLEQIARPGFAFAPGPRSLTPLALKGKSAHLIVTMGMPAFVYRWFFFKHSLTSLKRSPGIRRYPARARDDHRQYRDNQSPEMAGQNSRAGSNGAVIPSIAARCREQVSPEQ